MVSLDAAQAQRLIEGKPWHHAFEVVPGVRVPGSYDPHFLLERLGLPSDLSQVTVADLGASNGYFSFELRRRGAKVTAFDFRHRENSGFALLQLINGLEDIEHHHVNVLDVTADRFGQFDIVLCLGLLYHVADPYRLLANCVSIARKQLFVESYCIDRELPESLLALPIVRFIPDPGRFPGLQQPNSDTSNFWGLSSKAIELMIRDLGFDVSRVERWGDRCFIEACRSQSTPTNRLHTAYGIIEHVPLQGDPLDPQAWVIF